MAAGKRRVHAGGRVRPIPKRPSICRSNPTQNVTADVPPIQSDRDRQAVSAPAVSLQHERALRNVIGAGTAGTAGVNGACATGEDERLLVCGQADAAPRRSAMKPDHISAQRKDLTLSGRNTAPLHGLCAPGARHSRRFYTHHCDHCGRIKEPLRLCASALNKPEQCPQKSVPICG